VPINASINVISPVEGCWGHEQGWLKYFEHQLLEVLNRTALSCYWYRGKGRHVSVGGGCAPGSRGSVGRSDDVAESLSKSGSCLDRDRSHGKLVFSDSHSSDSSGSAVAQPVGKKLKQAKSVSFAATTRVKPPASRGSCFQHFLATVGAVGKGGQRVPPCTTQTCVFQHVSVPSSKVDRRAMARDMFQAKQHREWLDQALRSGDRRSGRRRQFVGSDMVPTSALRAATWCGQRGDPGDYGCCFPL
jgi:hypothetical protein